MEAPDLETLLNFAANFRAAGESVLKTRIAGRFDAGATQVYVDMAKDNRKSPRIETHYVHGMPTGSRRPAPIGKDARYRYYDKFRGQFVFNVWTNRDTANDGLHDLLCSLVRATMTSFGDYFTADVLPYYLLDGVKPGPERVSINAENTMDVTQLSFDLHWCVFADAWPADA